MLKAPVLSQTTFRSAGPGDAGVIARLHAESWRRHYRGAYSDSFLDGDVLEDRLSVWTKRLCSPEAESRTILAERAGELVGFAHTVLDEDDAWGSLIDNLHVTYGLKRQGIGTRLLAIAAQQVAERSPLSGMYLWVLEQNTDAQAFYARRGGAHAGGREVLAPGGDPARLTGRPVVVRYAWRDLSILLKSDSPGASHDGGASDMG
jgi:GNAT superfamily N-acetyltransferase